MVRQLQNNAAEDMYRRNHKYDILNRNLADAWNRLDTGDQSIIQFLTRVSYLLAASKTGSLIT